MVIGLYAAILGLMMIGLSVHVIRGRWTYREAIGAEAHELHRRVRAQGNFAEYAPLFIVLAGLAEYQGMSHAMLHTLGMWFVAGRVAHAYSLLSHERYEGDRILHMPYWRTCGMVSTFAVIGIISVALLVQYFNAK